MRAYSKNILRIFKKISNIRKLLISLNKICFRHKWFKKCIGSGPPKIICKSNSFIILFFSLLFNLTSTIIITLHFISIKNIQIYTQ
jgi:hypothetical protein